ncbi:hypothetical protein CEXT_198451 [Caerostris extrusa]|uniref:Uncharacterized protein n=1 Tax=Caerostris extrusa TaxID=172846 RepID=A0AAV4Q5Q4_CAEEX|nr:hypothetical protein CEXT_198451 [Caerostris extrusa]
MENPRKTKISHNVCRVIDSGKGNLKSHFFFLMERTKGIKAEMVHSFNPGPQKRDFGERELTPLLSLDNQTLKSSLHFNGKSLEDKDISECLPSNRFQKGNLKSHLFILMECTSGIKCESGAFIQPGPEKIDFGERELTPLV